jgi:hypothetical protein
MRGSISKRAQRGRTARLMRLFRGRRLSVGTRLSVAVVKPRAIGKVFRFKMRASRQPKIFPPRCLAPGSTKPQKTC